MRIGAAFSGHDRASALTGRRCPVRRLAACLMLLGWILSPVFAVRGAAQEVVPACAWEPGLAIAYHVDAGWLQEAPGWRVGAFAYAFELSIRIVGRDDAGYRLAVQMRPTVLPDIDRADARVMTSLQGMRTSIAIGRDLLVFADASLRPVSLADTQAVTLDAHAALTRA